MDDFTSMLLENPKKGFVIEFVFPKDEIIGVYTGTYHGKENKKKSVNHGKVIIIENKRSKPDETHYVYSYEIDWKYQD